ncbi:superoxide dismutase family protein [Phenylobacterium sp. 20VBR1]|uniref:Superoxide dismutase [Cu-Zn] n=1 Tax=Phenylobacterium glaciei TaxID=2803784 RepID=A0A941HVB0_9CAUL|nr:superoxide dismutase family protein [Phenylobacterium glaciei]MBR7619579.1 superoxide dismutase family protein [Phenylobacterium glaciei]
MKYAVLGLIASVTATAALAATPTANLQINLKNSTGGSAGTVTLTEAPNGVLLRLEAKGLTPGWHGLHFHEKGDCSAAGFTSAGAHVHGKASVVHGLLNPNGNEAGDLPNLYVAADGTGTAELFSSYTSLSGAGARPALMDTDGSALVIHANPDDHKTQPIGGAGPRVACGVIPKG